MKDIIQWLLKVEHAAGTAYANALLSFNDDPEFKKFLIENAEDEAWHYHVMASAAEHIGRIDPGVPVVTIDNEMNQKVLGILTEINDSLIENKLSKEQFLKAMALTEFSEWNDIFIYVVNNLKNNFREFSIVTPRIERHKRAIEVYLEKHSGVFGTIPDLSSRPKLWEEKILIIEDDEFVAELLKAILKKEGHIDIACNGRQGYEKMEKEYYKLIISDIDMPEMDGFQLYNTLKNLYPEINSRYIFITGYLSPEREAFFNQNNLAYLEKPISVSKIRQYSLGILLAN
jgi:CheY-like chemotaxis protein